MKWLVLIHVLSAIIGVGPTFFGHVLFQRKQSLESLRISLKMGKSLEWYPKIGGSIAVLSGIALILVSDYGPFLQLWLIGSLLLYVLIQIVAVGVLIPLQKKLAAWVFDPANQAATVLSEEQQHLFFKANRLYWVASGLGTLLFIFMILRPAFQL